MAVFGGWCPGVSHFIPPSLNLPESCRIKCFYILTSALARFIVSNTHNGGSVLS